MRLVSRLSRFISVGVISTLLHYFILAFLIWMSFELWVSNLLAFSAAFVFSFSCQQRYTFADRLGKNSSLNQRAAVLIFVLNLILSGVSAQLASKELIVVLPLLPAVVNYFAYYLMSGLQLFKKKYR